MSSCRRTSTPHCSPTWRSFSRVHVRVRRLDPDIKLPERAHPGDAGIDLCASIDTKIAPGGGRELVPTGIALAIPEGCGGFVLPRSGLALRHGVNHDPTSAFEIRRGDRIAQLAIQRVEHVEWDEVDSLDDTVRGLGGWGSTGSR